MNDKPERDQDDPELGPDEDNEIPSHLVEDFVPEDLLGDADDDLLDDDLDGDEFLEPDDEPEEVIVIPPHYAAAAVPEPAVPEMEEEPEPLPPPANPFDPGGPFAVPAPAPAVGRSIRRRTSGESDSSPQVFTVFKPESSSGTMIGLAGLGLCLILGLALAYRTVALDAGMVQFGTMIGGGLLLGLAALIGYWTWGSATLRYVIDRNSLVLRWGAQRQVIPLVNIERLIPADPDGEAPDVQGVDWPGHHVGRARVPQLGDVLFYSGHRRMSDVLYVQTPSHTYAISVPDAVAFAEVIQTNQIRGPLFDQRQAVFRDGIAAQSFWLDPQARFLTVVLIGAFMVAAGYVLNMYPGLAQSVPLRFPALGDLVPVTDKSALLGIPRSGGVFLVLNLILAVAIHPWERMVSIVLLLAGIALQIALLVAAIVAVA